MLDLNLADKLTNSQIDKLTFNPAVVQKPNSKAIGQIEKEKVFNPVTKIPPWREFRCAKENN